MSNKSKTNVRTARASGSSLQRVVRPLVKYMHTVDNQPATYDGEQICFAVRTRPIKLANSLRQIRREQHATIRWRLAQKWDAKGYGYMRVEVA